MAHNLIARNIDSFNPQNRLAALADILRDLNLQPNASAGPGRLVPGLINMHIHSFYSYNARGYSPAHIALECRRNNFYAAGLCDFDVLDGLEEFFTAGEKLGLRVAVHLETRAFLREYAEMDINSPGEPGVAYIMGAGFGSLPPGNSPAGEFLRELRRRANARNRALVGRINARLPEIMIDYDAQVLPLSPGGCPTERHIVQAYRAKAQDVFADREKLTAFWSKLMRKTAPETAALLNDPPVMDDKIRSLLAKSGGIGYAQPDEKTFPPADDFIRWVLQCGAVPMATWLDGTSRGETNMLKILECLQAKGAAALNIIPDRNHNIKNQDERRVKLQKLNEVISAARKLQFPVNIGTEMNKNGQLFADDLDCAALADYRHDFLEGAAIMVGQGVLTRYAGFSYCGPSAQSEFGRDTARKNRFFAQAGNLPPLSVRQADCLRNMPREKAFLAIRDSANQGKWQV